MDCELDRVMDGAFSLLFVDDDIVLQDLVKYSLKRDPNIHLEYSSSGAAALERLSQPGIDVVLSDVMMPHMSGPDLLAAMRRNPNLARVPVIFITASTLSVPEAQAGLTPTRASCPARRARRPGRHP